MGADQMRGSRGAIDSFKEDFTAFPGCIGQWDNGLATMPRIYQIRPSAVAKCIQSTRWDPGMIAVWQSLRAGDPEDMTRTWGRQVAIFSALNESVSCLVLSINLIHCG